MRSLRAAGVHYQLSDEPVRPESRYRSDLGRIESTVHQIALDRLNDGQFDDCDITMRDIRLVEESLVKTLCGIYHGRVAYPKARKDAEESLPPARLDRKSVV